MTNKNKNQTTGALAPQKERLFSINVDRQETRVKIVNNAPQQEVTREIIRNRVRAD